MPLDRTSIEKKDFPIGRRGYDKRAVDSHLRDIAEQVEELHRASARRTNRETLAGIASERVQAILDAAEQSSAEIRSRAEEDARALRDEASSESQHERDEAIKAARQYVKDVSEAASKMRSRLDAMESELVTLGEALRTDGNRLTAEFENVESVMADLSAAASARQLLSRRGPGETAHPGAGELEADSALATAQPKAIPAGPAEDEDEALEAAEPKTAAELEPEPEVERPERGNEEEEEDLRQGNESEPEEEPLADDDAEGARLIALNMALNGTPRAETDRYLAENFELSARGRLLDEVYASVEG